MKKYNLNEYLTDYKEYLKGITIEQENIFVNVVFNNEWTILKSTNENVKCRPSKQGNGEWFFYGNMNTISLDDITEVINENIRFNQEINTRKEVLEKKKIELTKLISEAPINKLESLRFTFRKKSIKNNNEDNNANDKEVTQESKANEEKESSNPSKEDKDTSNIKSINKQ